MSGVESKPVDQAINETPPQNDVATEVSSAKIEQIEDLTKKLDKPDQTAIQNLISDLAISKENEASTSSNHKFWSTQPVPQSSISSTSKPIREGPIAPVDQSKVPKIPAPLIDGFEWCTMTVSNPDELEEVRCLLEAHYVEDLQSTFRFNYSSTTLSWALMAPGWKREWHVGVRTSTGAKKLVAFISAIPITLAARGQSIQASEVNFMCVHKKLRAKRLAPVLITEITRRCHLEGIEQAIYTGGILLPTPVASCRYYHRSLNWEKLYQVGFSHIPNGSTKARQVAKFKLPDHTSVQRLRAMEEKDVGQVKGLLVRYMEKMQLAQVFEEEEVKHWFVDKEKDVNSDHKVVWSYVVENEKGDIVDFFSFYCLASTNISPGSGSTVVKAAYLFYYATEIAFEIDDVQDKLLKKRLNELVRDALIIAKKANFDVFNAVTHLDNPLFLKDQLFGAGDGYLHYYLYNYRLRPLPDGVSDSKDDAKKEADESRRRGCGVVML